MAVDAEITGVQGVAGTRPKPPRFRRRRRGRPDEVLNAVATTLEHLPQRRPLSGKADGAGVRVAILDTWPLYPPTRRWRRGQVAERPFQKIRDFLNQSGGTLPIDDALLRAAAQGKLVPGKQIFDYVGDEDADAPEHSLDACGTAVANFDHSDHGLFIADIIRDIAPAADLYLYRVLRGLTCNSLHELLQALRDLADRLLNGEDAKKPLIINLSMGWSPSPLAVRAVLDTVEDAYRFGPDVVAEAVRRQADGIREAAQKNAPADARLSPEGRRDAVRNEKLKRLVDAGLARQAPDGSVELTGELTVIQELISLLRHQNVLLIAAAGNESCPTDPEPRDPLVPAAIEDVLGVSATVKLGGPFAPYSNADDLLAPDDGIPAVGGDVNQHLVSTGGLYGLAISETLYDATGATVPNTAGLARWSGTSFAAPVATGFAACLWSEMPNAPAKDILDAIVNDPNGAGERPVVPLEQSDWQ